MKKMQYKLQFLKMHKKMNTVPQETQLPILPPLSPVMGCHERKILSEFSFLSRRKREKFIHEFIQYSDSLSLSTLREITSPELPVCVIQPLSTGSCWRR